MKNYNYSLPLELIRDIFLRLPVKSVARFKCVCKSWLSLISDPQFGISHFDLAAVPSHRILLRSNDFSVQSIDVEDFNAVHFPLPTPSLPNSDLGYFHDKHGIVGSCRGLVLLCYETSSDLILWNPSIGAHKLFPNFEFDLRDGYLYGFVYDALTDDYLLILVALFGSAHAQTEFKIFSFKTNSWDRLGFDEHQYLEGGDEFSAGSLVNGALHWLVFCEYEDIDEDIPFSFIEYAPCIVAFDLIERSFRPMPLFLLFCMQKYQLYGLRELGGCLSVCCSRRACGMVEIWVMKEYKVLSSWTKTIVIPAYDIPHNQFPDQFSPICIAKDGGVFGSSIGGRLEKRDDEGKLREHLIDGEGQAIYCANLQTAMYRESLLPLSGVIGEANEDVQQ